MPVVVPCAEPDGVPDSDGDVAWPHQASTLSTNRAHPTTATRVAAMLIQQHLDRVGSRSQENGKLIERMALIGHRTLPILDRCWGVHQLRRLSAKRRVVYPCAASDVVGRPNANERSYRLAPPPA